jgi:hypothetical protein
MSPQVGDQLRVVRSGPELSSHGGEIMKAQYDTTGRTIATKARKLAVGLLTTAEDFAAMRNYSSFEFTDYQHYLAEHVRLLENLRAHGRSVRIGCFDPCEYLHFCATVRVNPDSAQNRARYVQEISTSDPQLPSYTGQPLSEIIAELESDRRHQTLLRILFDLLDDSVRAEEYPMRVMLRAEGHAARTFASIVNGAGQGRHQVVLSTVGESAEQATVTLDFTIDGEALTLSKRRVIDALIALYALCYVRRVPAGITLLSTAGGSLGGHEPTHPTRVWRLADQNVLLIKSVAGCGLAAGPRTSVGTTAGDGIGSAMVMTSRYEAAGR